MPENPYPVLRQRILNAKVRMEKPPPKPIAFAGLMEMGVENGVASLAVVADGTTSLYYSNGGGIIGAGQREPVKKPSTLFLGMLSRHLGEMGPDPTGETPGDGMIHLRAMTTDGRRLLAAAPEEDLKAKRHPLWEAFYAGQAVITVLRTLPPIKAA